MKKQFLSILLAFCMIVALLPITAMAADDELVITGNAGGYTWWCGKDPEWWRVYHNHERWCDGDNRSHRSGF